MAQQSTIEWTDNTWNPVAGCSLASAGCTNCYAMRMAGRLEAMGSEKYLGLTRKSGGKVKWTRDGSLPKPWERSDSNTSFDAREKEALKAFLNGIK